MFNVWVENGDAAKRLLAIAVMDDAVNWRTLTPKDLKDGLYAITELIAILPLFPMDGDYSYDDPCLMEIKKLKEITEKFHSEVITIQKTEGL
ncbi:MAG: hypothetical protein AB4352_21150 [Hormoscilla sp.]